MIFAVVMDFHQKYATGKAWLLHADASQMLRWLLELNNEKKHQDSENVISDITLQIFVS